MIRIREIDHLVLRVVNVDSVLRFCCGVFGCRSSDARTRSAWFSCEPADRSLISCLWMASSGGRAAAPGREGRNLDHFCFRIDPFDEPGVRRHLEAHGVEVGSVASRYGAEGLGSSIYVTDPEGNVVELKGPPEG